MGVGRCSSGQRHLCLEPCLPGDKGQCWCEQFFLGSATPACPHMLGHLSLDLWTSSIPTELGDLSPGSWSFGLEPAHSSGAPQALPWLPFPAPVPFSQMLGLVLDVCDTQDV